MGCFICYWSTVLVLAVQMLRESLLTQHQHPPSRIAASYQEGALFRKSHSTSLDILCSVSVHNNKQLKTFQASQMLSWLEESCFQSDSQLPEISLGSPVTLCYHLLSALQIPGVTVPRSFTTWQKPPVVQPICEWPVCSSAWWTHRTEPWWAVWRQVAGLEPAAVLGINRK